eukprot:354069-Chlamydomonas_euryale.AAC.1
MGAPLVVSYLPKPLPSCGMAPANSAASMLTDAKSLTSTPTDSSAPPPPPFAPPPTPFAPPPTPFAPTVDGVCVSCSWPSRWRSSVVFPAPRKPLSTTTGTLRFGTSVPHKCVGGCEWVWAAGLKTSEGGLGGCKARWSTSRGLHSMLSDNNGAAKRAGPQDGGYTACCPTTTELQSTLVHKKGATQHA